MKRFMVVTSITCLALLLVIGKVSAVPLEVTVGSQTVVVNAKEVKARHIPDSAAKDTAIVHRSFELSADQVKTLTPLHQGVDLAKDPIPLDHRNISLKIDAPISGEREDGGARPFDCQVKRAGPKIFLECVGH